MYISDETPNMKIGTNAENLTVIENLRAVLEKSADEINDNHDKEMVEASGSGDGELDSSERKSKSIDQVSNLFFILNLTRNLFNNFFRELVLSG